MEIEKEWLATIESDQVRVEEVPIHNAIDSEVDAPKLPVTDEIQENTPFWKSGLIGTVEALQSVTAMVGRATDPYSWSTGFEQVW